MNVLTHRTVLRACAIGLAVLIAGAACANDDTGSSQKNVLLIYVDDLRPEINCYGKSKIISPNIDKLAVRSLVFNDSWLLGMCQLY